MRNRVLTIAAVGSLIFVGIVLILWVRSFVAKADRVAFAAGQVWEIHLTSYRGGFTLYRDRQSPRYSQYELILAGRYAFVVLLGLIAPAWRWGRSPSNGQAGRCESCGYDLRATPQRCPECGREPGRLDKLDEDQRSRNLTWLVGAAALGCLYVALVMHPERDIAEDAASLALVLGLACMFTGIAHRKRGRRARSLRTDDA